MPKEHQNEVIGKPRLHANRRLFAERTSPRPHGDRAVISQRGRSVMQSGRARSQEWLLEFEPHGRQIPDSLMGGPVEPSVLHRCG